MEDELNKKNGRRPQQKWKTTSTIFFFKLKTNQSTKINLIGCDTIVNSPSYFTDRMVGGGLLQDICKLFN
jgi:hypothetical protein